MKTAIHIFTLAFLSAKASVVFGAPFTCTTSQMNFPPDQKVSPVLCDTLLKSSDTELLWIGVSLKNPFPGTTSNTDPKKDTVPPGPVDTTTPAWVIELSNKLFHDFELFDVLDTSRVILPDHFNLTTRHYPEKYQGSYGLLLARKATIISMVDSDYVLGIQGSGRPEPATIRKPRIERNGKGTPKKGHIADALGRRSDPALPVDQARVIRFHGGPMK